MSNVLIIGGSSGIGLACTRLFLEKNWNVYATYFTNKKTQDSLVKWSFLDITDSQAVKSYIAKLPKLDAIVICAAKNKSAPLNDSSQELESVFETNIISHIRIMSLLKVKLKVNSSVTLFSSITGFIGSENRIAYSSSKAAISGLVKSLARDLRPYTRVNAVSPGYIKTKQYSKNSSVSDSERRKRILLDRLGKPEEVAQLVLFLSMNTGSYINGQIINIDGGIN